MQLVWAAFEKLGSVFPVSQEVGSLPRPREAAHMAVVGVGDAELSLFGCCRVEVFIRVFGGRLCLSSRTPSARLSLGLTRRP